MERTEALTLLRTATNNPHADFRDGQWEAITALVNQKQRALVVQSTGWGKSMVYFIATRILRNQGSGPTLIVSPLLALMRNQVAAAHRLQITAATINSSNSSDWKKIQNQILNNEIDALLISPERLANEDFLTSTLLPIAAKIGLLVIDEAHCISDWGHDFRPDYRRIARILNALPPNLPVLATTATANNRVFQDVAAQLGSNLITQRGSLTRTSLILDAAHIPNPAERMAWLADHLRHLPGSGIIYTLTVLIPTVSLLPKVFSPATDSTPDPFAARPKSLETSHGCANLIYHVPLALPSGNTSLAISSTPIASASSPATSTWILNPPTTFKLTSPTKPSKS